MGEDTKWVRLVPGGRHSAGGTRHSATAADGTEMPTRAGPERGKLGYIVHPGAAKHDNIQTTYKVLIYVNSHFQTNLEFLRTTMKTNGKENVRVYCEP